MKGKVILLPAMAAGIGAMFAARANRQQEPYSFNGKSVIITGGSRGLGLVLARTLADEGAQLTLLARNPAELDRAVADITARGGEVIGIRCDVRDRQQCEDTIRRVVDRRGRIDVLINNAGVIQAGPVEHMNISDFEDAMSTHMWGPLYTMLAAIPHMREQGGGRIVNISSIGGKIAVPHLLPYSASKFALVGLSDGMRAELAKDRIHVTTVAPGLMRTGSPVNAFFKGRHSIEYAWFALTGSSPITSISATRAARQIIEATRRGDPELTITIQARLAILASTLAPSLFARTMQIVGGILPGPAGDEGDHIKTGWESRSRLSDTLLTAPMYRAAQQNNEANGHKLAGSIPTGPLQPSS